MFHENHRLHHRYDTVDEGELCQSVSLHLVSDQDLIYSEYLVDYDRGEHDGSLGGDDFQIVYGNVVHNYMRQIHPHVRL